MDATAMKIKPLTKRQLAKYRRGKPPKDGTWIVGWWNGKPSCRRIEESTCGPAWHNDSGTYYLSDPTKWMPLP